MSKHDKLTLLLDEFGSTIRESAGERADGSRAKLVAVPANPRRPQDAGRPGHDYETVPLRKIVTRKQHRTRFDSASLQELADSILALGMIEPIVVRSIDADTNFELVAGERRFRAATIAKLEEIPVRIMNLSDAQVSEVQLAENLAREDLNPIDLAQAFRDVMDKTGHSAKDLAKRVGVDPTTITRTLRLLTLPTDVRETIASGQLSPAIAREVARIKDGPTQRMLLSKAQSENLSAADVAELVKEIVGTKRVSRKGGRRGAAKALKRLTFAGENAVVVVIPDAGATYHDVAAALTVAAEEVELRIDNGVTI